MNKIIFEQNIKSRVGKKIHTHINILFIRVFFSTNTQKKRNTKSKSHYINNKHYLSIYLAAVPVVDWNIGAFGTPEAFFKSWFDCCEVCP